MVGFAQIAQPLLDARNVIVAGITLLFQLGVAQQQLNHLRPRHRGFVVFYHAPQVRHIERAAPEHDRVAAGNAQAILRILPVPDFAVGDHRNCQTLANFTNRLPVDALCAIAVLFGPAMHHQLAGTGLLHRIGDLETPRARVPAEPHFHRDRQMSRHRLAHRSGTAIDQLRIFQQRRTAAAAVHQLRRAAAVEVNAPRAQLHRACGVFCQPLWILAQQLHAHARAGGRPAVMVQFRTQTIEGFYRQQLIDHA